jgi:hypothetical protein
MSAMMVDLQRQIDEAEGVVSTLKEKHRMVKEETIPMMMQEIGLESVTLITGEKLTVEQEVYASIPAPQREQAYAWLEEHNFGSIIKTEVEAQFGKGESKRAIEILQLLKEQGVEAELSRSVHAQTLKAFLKECLSNKVDIPLDMFGARPTWTTKVKPPKN